MLTDMNYVTLGLVSRAIRIFLRAQLRARARKGGGGRKIRMVNHATFP